VGAPSDTPPNWWRHFHFEATREYPEQRPVSERELWDLCLASGLKPVAVTRIDPWYGRVRRAAIAGTLYRCFAAWWPSKEWALDRFDGGLVVVLAEKTAK
jgi:hypothetical protein